MSPTPTQPQQPSQPPHPETAHTETAHTETARPETAHPEPAHPDPTTDPALYESRNVHSVYSAIAPHFSQTRHKPWPLVASFLLAQPAGSVGLDVGCGNGKYLSVNPGVVLIGSDRSAELVRLARGSPEREVLVADGLDLPFGPGRADFVISVAVVHHFATRERRVAAVRALLGCLREGTGRAMVYVWALEQGASRRGWDEGMEQDQLVPWVMRRNQPKKRRVGKGRGGKGAGEEEEPEQDQEGKEEEPEQTFQRYYHLYRKGELEDDVVAAGGVVLESGYERDNWWAIATRAS